MRKICVVTGSRAEYGLLYWLMKEIQQDAGLELQVIVTGMHLSPEFGLTYKEIEKEFPINKKIEILLSSDTSIGISKSMGLAQISFAEAYAELRPEIVVVLGDRFEIFSAATAAMIARVPIAHIHGGETTEGAFDEAIRHSITKMSHLHFVATESYRHRVIQLGEDPDRVFNFGAPGLDSISNHKLLAKEKLEKEIGFKLGKKNLLVTFHPATLEENTAKEQFRQLLLALDEQKDTHNIFTKANADTDGRVINSMIDDYVAANPDRTVAFASLGQLRYLSALQYVDAVVGNSSSGLIEAPSFKIGTINIGDRQKGRIKAASVIDCAPDANAISEAIQQLYSADFQQSLVNTKNPYGQAGASKKIADILRTHSLKHILKKHFNDLTGCQ
jgi:GDP/UDP-N,N'-diacetylbacillosamine 2-epimerase (hydrolysing)